MLEKLNLVSEFTLQTFFLSLKFFFMIDFAKKLYDDLLLKLKDLESKKELSPLATELPVDAIETAIALIKDELKDYHFFSVEEEVEFFKSVMPMFLALRIYHTEKMEIESLVILEKKARNSLHVVDLKGSEIWLAVITMFDQ